MAVEDKPLKDKDGTGVSYADRRREEKNEALRDFVRGQQYLHAINRDLDRDDITQDELPVIKFKTDTRLKLLGKVLPDLKAIEHSGDSEKPIGMFITWQEPK